MQRLVSTVIVSLLAALSGGAQAEEKPSPIEMRSCGKHGLTAYPLSSEAGMLQGLLLHDLAIINHTDAPIKLTSVQFDLLSDRRVIEARTLGQPELTAFGALGRQIEAIPVAKTSFDLICGVGQLLPKGVALAGPALAAHQAMLIRNQVFAFDGSRDSLRVHVVAAFNDRTIESTTVLPISTAMAKTQFRFPLRGVWVVKSGPSFHTHHRWALPSEFALDLVKFDAGGHSHKGDGAKFSDYHAYGQEVLAAADGRVVKIVNDRAEPTDLLTRPGETLEAFWARIAAYEQTLFAAGVDGVTGNHVVIDHGNGEYSLYAHLQSGGVRVRAGQLVKAGEAIAKLGGSGNSLVEPHLHFQVCDRPTPLACTGIPTAFSNIEIPYVSFTPRPLQSGDIVVAN